MAKYLLNFLCIFMFLSPLSLAKEAFDEAFLQKEFGQDLTKAPFFYVFLFIKNLIKIGGNLIILNVKPF